MRSPGRLVALAACAALVVALAPTAWAATPGPAYSWGANNNGRLGTGPPVPGDVLAPKVIFPARQFTSISAGWRTGCALGDDDSAYCWGYGLRGQLGNGSTDDSSPVPVRALGPAGGFGAIAVGYDTSCALEKSTSVAYCWGEGSAGELGNGSNDDTSVPVAVSGGQPFRGIDVGFNSACAVALDDSAYCWGRNSDGQLGVGRSGAAFDDTSNVPVLVSGSYRFAEVSVGAQFACGVTRTSGFTGPGVCWGKGSEGRLGNGSTDDTNVPVTVDDTAPGLLMLRSITAGDRHACAISVDDSAYCWGDGSNGQLGNGSSGDNYRETRPTRVIIPGNAPVRDISAGSFSSCAITDDTAYCWGADFGGQLGNGSPSGESPLPVAVAVNQPEPGIGAANSPVQVTSGENYNAFIVMQRMTFAGTAFPSAQVGQSTSTLVPVRNTRPWTISITGTSVTGAGVSVTPSGTTCSGALPSGATCTVSLAWTPASAGALSGASLTINYVGNSSTTPLTGTATAVPVAQPSIAPAAQTLTGVVGTVVTPTSRFTVENFTSAPTFSIYPPLPAGLSLDPATGVVSGTPTVVYPSTRHWITATALGGAQTATSTLQVTVNATTPSPPRGVTATGDDARIAVTWQASQSDGGSPITGYTATASPGGATCTSTGTTCTLTGLTNGTAYTVSVTAINAIGASSPMSAGPVTPGKPSITITGSRDGQRITVTGTAMHLTSPTVRPWIKFPGQPTYTEGATVIPVSTDGTFTWSRKTNKKTYIFIAHGTTRSNVVTIPAR